MEVHNGLSSPSRAGFGPLHEDRGFLPVPIIQTLIAVLQSLRVPSGTVKQAQEPGFAGVFLIFITRKHCAVDAFSGAVSHTN